MNSPKLDFASEILKVFFGIAVLKEREKKLQIN